MNVIKVLSHVELELNVSTPLGATGVNVHQAQWENHSIQDASEEKAYANLIWNVRILWLVILLQNNVMIHVL